MNSPEQNKEKYILNKPSATLSTRNPYRRNEHVDKDKVIDERDVDRKI